MVLSVALGSGTEIQALNLALLLKDRYRFYAGGELI